MSETNNVYWGSIAGHQMVARTSRLLHPRNHQQFEMSSESKPISLAEFKESIRELTDDTLTGVQASIETSLLKLQETNDFLLHELEGSTETDDRALYEETIEENKGVISSQKLKLDALKEELLLRGLATKEKEGETEEGVYL